MSALCLLALVAHAASSRSVEATSSEVTEERGGAGSESEQLLLACKSNDLKMVKHLFKGDKHFVKTFVNQKEEWTVPGFTAAHYAAQKGYGEILTAMSSFADFEIVDNYGFTPLTWAAMHGRVESVQALVQGGANVDFRTFKTNETALHFAAIHGHKEVLCMLLAAGAIPDITTRDGTTPLMLVVQNDQAYVDESVKVECAKALLENGADKDKKRSVPPYHTPKVLAQQNGYLKLVSLFREKGEEVKSIARGPIQSIGKLKDEEKAVAEEEDLDDEL